MRVVAALPALGLIAGSALGLVLPDIPFGLGIVLLSASVALALWAWRGAASLLLALAVVGGFAVGGAMLSADAWRTAWRPSLRTAFEELARRERESAGRERRRLPEDDEAFATVEGILREDAAPSAAGVSLSVEVDAIARLDGGPDGARAARADGTSRVAGGLLLTVVGRLAAERMDEWRAGRRIRASVQLRRPSRYLNPGVPDAERALARRGTTLVGSVKSGALVEVLDRGSRLDEATAAARGFARRAILQTVGLWSQRSAAIVAAIVIGDRAGLDEDLQRRLQDAGTYHVIAISGGNIAIVAALLLGMFRLAGVLGRSAMASAIVVLLAYARLVGGGASVNRATLMAVVYFAARSLDHRSPPLNALAFAVICLLTAQPLAVVDPALVLTCGATLALLLAAPLASHVSDVVSDVVSYILSYVVSGFSWTTARVSAFGRTSNDAGLSRTIRQALAPPAALLTASIAVEVFVLPVGAVFFSRVTFAGLALNFVAIPLMGVAQLAGMAIVPLYAVFPRVAVGLGWIAHLAASALIRSADLVELMPLATWRVASPGWLAVGTYYVALALACAPWLGRSVRRAAFAATALVGLWIVAEPWALVLGRGDGRLHLTFPDVGQGDSTLVRFPRGSTLLVDAGGLPSAASGFDVGDRVVAPVLRSAGIRRIDVVALTHGDPDHIGGARSLIREFRPLSVWEGVAVPQFEPLRVLRAEAAAAGARWLNVKAGDATEIDGVAVLVRHPPPPDWERQRVRNDDSIVIELRWRNVSVVLTGDIGAATERTLLTAIPTALVRVVKVPHHGSLTSSTPEFIRALAPAVAVVSAGRSNHFGHPTPEVLARYRDAGAEVFRTDQDGATTVDTDGSSLMVSTFTGREYVYGPQRAQRMQGGSNASAH